MSGKIRTNGAAAFDLSSLLGTTVDVNSGNKSAGTLRVVLATDQPQLSNALLVAKSGTWDITNAGTFAVQENGAALTSLQLIDDTVYASDAAISKVLGIGGQFDDVSPGTTTENSVRAIRMSTRREMYVQIRDAAGNERGLNIDASGQLAITLAASQTLATVTTVGTVTNLAQMNGAAITMGNGVAGTGVQRVAIASDNTAFSVNPVSATVPVSTMNSASANNGVNSAIAAVFDDTTPTAITENSFGFLRMSANRNQYVTIRDAAGNERGLNIDASGQLAITIASAQTLATVTTVSTVTAFGTGTTGPMKAEDAAHANGDQGLAVWAVRLDTPVSGANASASADYVPFITDSFGKLWVTGSYAEDLGHTSADPGMFVMAVRSDTLAASSGTTGDYEAFHTDSIGALWVRSSAEIADDAAFTVATSRVMPVGLMADETSTDSVDEGDVGIPRMTLDRKQIVVPEAHTAGGATPYMLISAASTNATSLKGSAGQIYSIYAANINAAVRYLKLYNKATAPTVGTDTPLHVIPIPGATTGGGVVIPVPVGMEFTTGIAFALTTGIATSDTGAVAANEIVVNITYK